MQIKYRNLIPEALIALMALVLRIPGIGSASLTMEEAKILVFAGESWHKLLQFFLADADRYFGGSLPCVAIAKIAGALGPSPLAPRAASLIFGLLTIFFIYLFAYRMFGRGAAVFASLLLTVNPYHIMVSRSVGTTATGLFLLMAGIYLFHKIFEEDDSRSTALGFAIVMILGVNYHYYCAMLLIPVNILFLGFAKNRNEKLFWWIPLNLLVAGLIVFWLPRWTAGYFMPSMDELIANKMLEDGVIAVESFFNMYFHLVLMQRYVQMMYVIGGFVGPLLNFWSVAGAVLIPIVYHYFPLIGFREYEDGYRPRLFMFMFLAGFLGVASILSSRAVPQWDYLLAASMIIYVVLANGIVRFTLYSGKAVMIFAILCVLLGSVPAQKIVEESRPDWKKVASVMNESENAGSPLVITDYRLGAPVIFLAPELRSRTFVLAVDSIMERLGDDRGRLFWIMTDRHNTAIQEIMATAPETWVLIENAGEKIQSTNVHEREMWLLSYGAVMEEIDIGGNVILKRYMISATPKSNPLDIK